MILPSNSVVLTVFVLASLGAFYAYLGYPLLLWIWAKASTQQPAGGDTFLPNVTIMIPAHNESAVLPSKLDNLARLEYPVERLEILVVSDASTDGTVEIAREFARGRDHVRTIALESRGGKAGALNAGLDAASHEVIVFTDASIQLEPGSLRALVQPFAEPSIGCASGEDRVEGGGGEALYGCYELFLRRKESVVGSIVGASGSYYAQRRELCGIFPDGIAPDFLSVLRTVQHGLRAVTVPGAGGTMRATASHGREFQRKVRTLVRGMTGLFGNVSLMNPMNSGSFAFLLFSHKVMRWLVPWFLLTMAGSHLLLLDAPAFRVLAVPHFGFYLLGLVGLVGPGMLRRWLPLRIAAYFVTVHAAMAVAWWRYLSGVRQEVWSPTTRS